MSSSEAALRLYHLAADEETAVGLHLKNADLTGEELEHLTAHGCVFEGCRFLNADLSKAAFTDCVLKHCDFSGAKLFEAYFARCWLQSCKGLGTNFAETRLFDVQLSECLLCYACFDRTKWDRAIVECCCLAEGMLTDSTLKRVRFAAADLSRVNLHGTMLKGLDLRGCSLTGTSYGPDCRELRGAVVDTLQAADLARLLGLVVRD